MSVYLPICLSSSIFLSVYLSVLNIFGLQMCFAPKRRALFTHLNVQMWSESAVFYRFEFWLRNLLRATAACAFSTAHLPKVLRTRGAFSATQRALFRHLNVQKRSEPEVFCAFWLQNALRATAACHVLISHPTKWLRIAALARSLLFHPPVPQNIYSKNTVFRDFSLFAHLDLLSSDCFFSLIFFLRPFSFLTLPTSAASSVHIVGSLTLNLSEVNPTFHSQLCWPPSWFPVAGSELSLGRLEPLLDRPLAAASSARRARTIRRSWSGRAWFLGQKNNMGKQ